MAILDIRDRGLMMINYIIPIVIVLLVFVVVVIVYRKKHHNEISRLEQKRLDVEMKPVLEELSKVKQLNMNGQAEEMFERWRNKWTELIDVDLKNAGEALLKIEDSVDKFQFKNATAQEQEIEQIIDRVDGETELILTELNELIESEENSRVEIEKLKLDYRTARKTLLAHQYSFGAAGEPLEKKLEVFPGQFEEYDVLISQGNYLQAKDIVNELDRIGKEIFQLISEIPNLLTEIQHKIPNDVKDIRNGFNEMQEQSFFLLHLEIPEKLESIEQILPPLKEEVINLKTENVSSQIESIKREIDGLYDALEGEAIAKLYVDENFDKMGERLDEVSGFIDYIKSEADKVQLSYHLTDVEIALPINARSAMNSYQQRYDLLAIEVTEEQSAYSSLKEELEDLKKLVDVQFEQAQMYSNKLVDLRVHENDGRAELSKLEARQRELKRKVQKANIPGVPDEITARLHESELQLQTIREELLEIPINVGVIAAGIEKSDILISEAEEVIQEMINNVQLIELLIQYGNRYRMAKPGMDEKLTEAEKAFRDLRFNRALEVAAIAVDSAEPGSLKKMEEIAKEAVLKS